MSKQAKKFYRNECENLKKISPPAHKATTLDEDLSPLVHMEMMNKFEEIYAKTNFFLKTANLNEVDFYRYILKDVAGCKCTKPLKCMNKCLFSGPFFSYIVNEKLNSIINSYSEDYPYVTQKSLYITWAIEAAVRDWVLNKVSNESLLIKLIES